MQRLRQRARAGGSAARELEAGKLCACTRVHGVRFVLSLMRLCSMVHLVWVLCACVHGVCLWVCMCVFYDVPDVFVFYDVPGAWVFWCPWCGFLCVLLFPGCVCSVGLLACVLCFPVALLTLKCTHTRTHTQAHTHAHTPTPERRGAGMLVCAPAPVGFAAAQGCTPCTPLLALPLC